MCFRDFFHKSCRSLRKILYPDNRQKLLELLRQEYVEKAQNVIKFTEYAANMTYLQFRKDYARCGKRKKPIGRKFGIC